MDAASQLNQSSFSGGSLNLQAEIHNHGVIGSTTSTCDVVIEPDDVINTGLIVAGNGNTVAVRVGAISGNGVIEIQPRSVLTFDYGGGSVGAGQVLRFANPLVVPIHFMKSFTQLRFGCTLMINPIGVTINTPILNFRPGDRVVITECDDNVTWTVTAPDMNGHVTLHLTARNDDFVPIDISLTFAARLGIAVSQDTNFSGHHVVTPRFITEI